jgi:hypothetical protein
VQLGLDGAWLAPLTSMPKVVDPPGGSAPLYPTLVAVTCCPDWETEAFQELPTVCVPAKANPAVQPVPVAVPVFLTVNVSWYPPGQELSTVALRAHPPGGWLVGVGEALGDRVGLALGLAVGDAVGLEVGLALGLAVGPPLVV